MNHYEARQRTGTEGAPRWDWTVSNSRRGTSIAAPCSAECEHKTKIEAERHYWEHSISEAVVKTSSKAFYECGFDGCTELTNSYMSAENDMRVKHLCDAHRTKEVFASIYPFSPGISISSSW